MKNLKFSILTPSYNASDVISDTIKSVLSQSFTNFEYIISDDNSTDDTVSIIKSFKDKRIKIIRNDKNVGYTGNLNRCLKYTSGDIVYLLADDDILSRDALSKTHQAFKISEDIGAVCRPYRWFDNDFDTTIRIRKPLNPKKNEIVTIDDDLERIVAVFQVLDSLSGLGMRSKFIDRPVHPDIFPAHIYPFASIFKKHPIVFLKDYVVSVSIKSSQCRDKSYIYDKSPILSWVEMFENVFPEKKFTTLRAYCIDKLVAKNYIGLVQIRNYSKHKYLFTIREIYYLLKYRPKNMLNPVFWLFAIATLITPAFLLRSMVDIYKNYINSLFFRQIRVVKAV